jgi:UDP-N-acetylbacillosamine N-acetyltransferase
MRAHFDREGGFEVAARAVDRPYLAAAGKEGPTLVPFDEVETAYPPAEYAMFLAIGYRNMRDRERMFQKAKEKGYRLVNHVSHDARVCDPEAMGENNVILGGSILEPFVRLGDNNIIWSGSILCHGTRVGDHNFFAAGTILGGECVVGNRCFLGFGATVTAHTTVADETLVGARSLILHDTVPATKYLGAPARSSGTHAERGIEILD